MKDIRDIMKSVINYCDICLDGCIISKEYLMCTFINYINATIEKDQHNINVVLHTGSVCFDAVLLAYIAISNIFYNETDPIEILHSLKANDLVLYDKQRYVFVGFLNEIPVSFSKAEYLEDGDYVVLKQNKSYRTVSKNNWGNIAPYQGKSKRLDGRGLRKQNNNRKLFFTKVLNIDENKIPSTIDVSTIILMPKNESTELFQGLSFKFDGVELRYTDLINVSYFTDVEQEYPIGGNAAKLEPVIKITSKTSIARKLLRKRSSNRKIGLVVLGNEMFQKGRTELPELIERKSIQYVYLCFNINYGEGFKLLKNYEEANLFACTRGFLADNQSAIKVRNEITKQLSEQVDASIFHEIRELPVTEILGWDKYRQYKRAIIYIKASDYESNEKDYFIIQAFSLMNLLLTAVFPISELEKAIEEGIIENIDSIQHRIKSMTNCYQYFPEYLHEKAEIIIEYLLETYRRLFDDSPKRKMLMKVIRENIGKRICIVVPKAYYIPLVKRLIIGGTTDVVTVGKLDNGRMYDRIISVGNITGRRFDIFQCKSAVQIMVLLYEAERYQYNKAYRAAVIDEQYMDQRSTLGISKDTYYDSPEIDNIEEIDEIDKVDANLNDFIGTSFAKSARSYMSGSGRNTTTDIIAIAKFDTDEVAFFTKNYKAYVLDQEAQTIQEEKVDDISEGDTIVFTRSNSKTRDIVDSILQKIVDKKMLSDELAGAYLKSKLWRTCLMDYMKENALNPKQISAKMKKNGVGVTETTIRGWLEEDSHTVGPRELSSIEQIAYVTGNKEMLENAEEYFNSCAAVRKVRRRILDAIAKATLTTLTGNDLDQDTFLATVQEQLNDWAVILCIEKISFVKEKVPTYMINRPVSIGIE